PTISHLAIVGGQRPPLQPAYEITDPFQRRLDIGKRVRKRQPQIAFAIVAERRSRKDRNAGLVQQTIREYGTRKTDLTDIRKKIKCSERLQTTDTGNSVQTIREHISPLMEFGHHSLRCPFGFRCESLESSSLRKCGRTGHAVVHEELDRRKRIRGN